MGELFSILLPNPEDYMRVCFHHHHLSTIRYYVHGWPKSNLQLINYAYNSKVEAYTYYRPVTAPYIVVVVLACFNDLWGYAGGATHARQVQREKPDQDRLEAYTVC